MKKSFLVLFILSLSCNSLKRGSQSLSAKCGYGTNLPGKDNIKHLVGGEIGTYKTFTYGKFKTKINYQLKEGVVIGFFLYSEETRDEIDFELVGVHGLQTNIPLHHEQEKYVTFEFPKEGERKTTELEIEWTPDGIRWRVDGMDVRYQRIKSTAPKKLLLNFWASAACDWSGILDLNNFQDQHLEVSYISYTPYDPTSKKFLEPEITDFETESSNEVEKNWYKSCHSYIYQMATVFNPKNVNIIAGQGLVISLTKNTELLKACHP